MRLMLTGATSVLDALLMMQAQGESGYTRWIHEDCIDNEDVDI